MNKAEQVLFKKGKVFVQNTQKLVQSLKNPVFMDYFIPTYRDSSKKVAQERAHSEGFYPYL